MAVVAGFIRHLFPTRMYALYRKIPINKGSESDSRIGRNIS